ncbi:FAD-binding oxidoreductase [Hoeflea sp. AS60]|uniref:FAD-binding oxidoreductase n=1 Tax=Hoeflea sp. AS60 TaxID=3135780 RepID=UPI0031711CFF
MNKITRRSLLAGAGAVAGAVGYGIWERQTIPSGLPFPKLQSADAGTILDDASLLNPTPVARHLTLSEAPDTKLLAALRTELSDAKSAVRAFSASAARHSMGGQSLPRDGTAVTFEQSMLEPDTAAGTYRVAAGVRWSQVIADLDRIGFSPKVMQSNNDFGVASTFAVNAHGWPVPHSAFGSTVRSLRLMRADGEVITCSRTENADQFNLAMGGYGLNGVILDLDVEMVKNERLVPSFETIAATDFGTKFTEALAADPSISMAYGRLDVTIDGFFDEALMITYRASEDQADLPAASGSGFMSKVSRDIFRRQLGSDRAKRLRWFVETEVGPRLNSGGVTRNSMINEPVVTLDDRDPGRTDILHEYFVSPARFHEFIAACQDVIPSSYQELLNITLRYVATDTDSVLTYATEPRIAAVMLFSQEMSERGEADMERMTSALIERTLAIGGTYYLPYRLHATDAQFQRGYTRAREFVARKRAADPDLVFRNALWDRYMAKL